MSCIHNVFECPCAGNLFGCHMAPSPPRRHPEPPASQRRRPVDGQGEAEDDQGEAEGATKRHQRGSDAQRCAGPTAHSLSAEQPRCSRSSPVHEPPGRPESDKHNREKRNRIASQNEEYRRQGCYQELVQQEEVECLEQLTHVGSVAPGSGRSRRLRRCLAPRPRPTRHQPDAHRDDRARDPLAAVRCRRRRLDKPGEVNLV